MNLHEDQDWDEYDDAYPYDLEDDDGLSETVDCPNCGTAVYEDAERCPACGNYVVHSSSYLWKNRPGWWVMLGLLGILAAVVALVF